MRFEVPGTPVAKGRPRFSTRGGFPRAFTPAKTVAFEERVALCAQAAGVRMVEGPVHLTVVAYFSMPKSKHRKRKPAEQQWKTTKPDLDNVVKAVKDSLGGIAWTDDAQVVTLSAEKYLAAQGEPARTVIEVRRMDG